MDPHDDPTPSTDRTHVDGRVRVRRKVSVDGGSVFLAVVLVTFIAGLAGLVSFLTSGQGPQIQPIGAAATARPTRIAPTPGLDQPTASPAAIATPAATAVPPTVAPASAEPEPTATPTTRPTDPPGHPSVFTATLVVESRCSSFGKQVVAMHASWDGPIEITRIVLSMDGVIVAEPNVDPAVVEGTAEAETSIIPGEAHEATAAFYSGDVLVDDGVSSGIFTVTLGLACGS
jgi:hypothetical protein